MAQGQTEGCVVLKQWQENFSIKLYTTLLYIFHEPIYGAKIRAGLIMHFTQPLCTCDSSSLGCTKCPPMETSPLALHRCCHGNEGCRGPKGGLLLMCNFMQLDSQALAQGNNLRNGGGFLRQRVRELAHKENVCVDYCSAPQCTGVHFRLALRTFSRTVGET